MNTLEMKRVSKIYPGKVSTCALTEIDFYVQKGEFVGIMGPSGSGKTTLLNMVATIDKPTSGNVMINGKDPFVLKKSELAFFRRRQLGFVFQDFNLLDTLTIRENIILPLVLDKKNIAYMEQRLKEIAKQLGITDILEKRTFEVSGGQQQRAAIARALIHSPALVLADEPTGNLDSKASRGVLELLEECNQKQSATMLMVTHDPIAASYCHRIVFIKDGRLYNEITRGDHRQEFFKRIVDVLSLLGGDAHDFSTIRF